MNINKTVIAENSLDAVSDRDFALEFASAASLMLR
jgi:argininosuccinate lyase